MNWTLFYKENAKYLVIVSALFTAILGCGGEDWQAATQPVSGAITINGKKPEGAIVTLFPAGETIDVRKSKPWGVVDAEGRYVVRTYESGDGAPVGEYRATVRWLDDPTVPNSIDLLNGAYANPDQSEYVFTIEPGQTELPPIEISGARVMEHPQAKRRRPSPFETAGAS